ncbi:MAG: AMP-binding protein [Clostridia bacterium]|nr:AMP-binding protein [Clostridia bacterium]
MIYGIDKSIEFSKNNNFISISTISFDMFIVETLIPFALGLTVILSNDEEQKIPKLMLDLIQKNKVKNMVITPSRMKLLLEEPKANEKLKTLNKLLLGGEVVTAELYNQISKLSAEVYNGYGPTETTACSSIKHITNEFNINIGKPISNTEIYIVNNDNMLCPIGVPGELCIGGDGVGKGYINNEALTKKQFIKFDFSDSKIYRTGDMARFLSTGDIEYIGRNDFQVKIRGLRIELPEIEKQILAILDVKKVVVTVLNKNKLVAFIKADGEIKKSIIRECLQKTLPSYMIPNIFVQVDEIPLTVTGKVDTEKLMNLVNNMRITETEYTAPKNELQQIFCTLWSKLLNMEVGIDDNFFNLGADSLMAIAFKTQLLDLDIEIPYQNIFTYPTVKLLSDSYEPKKAKKLLKEDNKVYEKIDKRLSVNEIENIDKLSKSKVNDILLLGATGFLGAHILDNFLKNEKGKVYCLIRKKYGVPSEERLKKTLSFYFGKKYNSQINKRICIIEGDIVLENLGIDDLSMIDNVTAVINSAAIVKHYGKYETFEKINIDGTKNIVQFCKKYNKKLLHMSTLSISGNSNLDYNNNNTQLFSERNLYINQELDNIYTITKYEAERIILEEIENGLKANILRFGNITNRYSDGCFQINALDNAFANRIKSFVQIGCVPKILENVQIDFAPVDYCADAVVKILKHFNNKFIVFHIDNQKHISGYELIKLINELGLSIETVDNKDFKAKILSLSKDKEKKKLISGVINDLDKNKELSYKSKIKINSDFTIEYLKKLNFEWPNINKNYLKKYIDYFKSINLW